MGKLVSDFKHKFKNQFILKNGYIKEKYWEYYAQYPENTWKNNIRKLGKVIQLNYEYRKRASSADRQEKLALPEELALKLDQYEVISFDVFDTLLLRKVEKPTDVFSYMETKYRFPRFCHLRVQAEAEARKKSSADEVCLEEIYDILSQWICIDKNEWMKREAAAEKKLCYANPYMKELVGLLRKNGKRMIAVSDMYLPEHVIRELLDGAGYQEIEKIFVSNEYQVSKGSGKLFDIVKEYLNNAKAIHIGDNIVSDFANAKKSGFDAWLYPNVNVRHGEYNLPYEMSRMTGTFTKAIINSYLNCGINQYSQYFAYGMVNGGLLACGYCEFLNRVVEEQKIDKILFVARDGYIIKRVYDRFYGECENEYILFSRFCSDQILFEKYPVDYVHHNLNYRLSLEKSVSLEQLFKEIDLDLLLDELEKYGLHKEELYSYSNSDKVADMIYKEKDKISAFFSSAQKNMLEYLQPVIKNHKRILVVDLGWYGTGGIALKYLLEEKYGMDIKVFSALAGTSEDSALEGRIAAKQLYPYAYSPVHNTYLLKWHNRHQRNVHNLLMELLFSAPQPSFLLFEKEEHGEIRPRFSYDEKENYDIINDMHKGILKFAELYHALDEDIREMLKIEGEDAYAAFMYTAQDTRRCYELFKDYKISELSGVWGNRAFTTMGQIMRHDNYI